MQGRVAMANFEKIFSNFVESIGGKVLPPSNNAKCADYLFDADDVIAELKTLEQDATADHQRKIQALAQNWRKRGLITPVGTRMTLDLQKLDPVCQQEWLQMLAAPVEHLVRDANRQIRGTKSRFKRDNASGLLLIANEGNHFHTRPDEYMKLVAIVLRKRSPTGESRFSHISGAVFFSHELGSTYDNGAPFWVPGHVGENRKMVEFQGKLRRGWLNYVSKLKSQPILEVWRKARE
jgi:hypothetical protein